MNLASWLLLGMLGVTGCRNDSAPTPDTDAINQKPSQVLKNFEMNDVRNGVKTMTLISIESRIYEAKKVADVDQPVIIFYKQGKESSRLTAPAGRVQIETHEVEAWGGVKIVTTDSSTLTTERLNYDPKKQRIYSVDKVRLEKPDTVTEGVGLETDPELKKVKIGRQTARFKKGMAR